MTRVTIASPNHALRVGLREMLIGQAGIEVVGETTDAEGVNANETEVLLLTSVSSLSRRWAADAALGVLLLTNDPLAARELHEAGVRAWGVLPEGATVEELVAAVRGVGEGLIVAAPALVQGLIRSQRGFDAAAGESPIEPLTAREKEVLQWLAEGLANKQIALQLGISEHTVKFHLSSLYGKLNVSGRAEAVRRGLSLGLILL